MGLLTCLCVGLLGVVLGWFIGTQYACVRVTVTRDPCQVRTPPPPPPPTTTAQGRRSLVNEVVLRVNSTACRAPVRLGAGGDGGWWVCGGDAIQQDDVVLSFGIAIDYSFDVAVERAWTRVQRIVGFDPSLMAAPAGYNQGKRAFYAVGVGPASRIYPAGTVPFRWPGMGYLQDTNHRPWQLVTLGDAMAPPYVALTQRVAIKMDVEGAEWYALEQLVANPALLWRIGQISVELHFQPGRYILARAPSAAGVVVRRTGIGGDDDDAIDILQRFLALPGVRCWRVEWNGDHCWEASFLIATATQGCLHAERSATSER